MEKSAKGALISSKIAWVGLLFAAAYYIGRFEPTQRNGTGIILLMGLAGITALCSVLGALFGFVALSHFGLKNRSAVLGTALSLVALGLALTGTGFLLRQVRLTTPRPGGLEHTVSPIPQSSGALTGVSVDATKREFLERNFLKPYREIGNRDAAWDAPGELLIHHWINASMKYRTNVLEDDTFSPSEKLLAAKCDDPLLLSLAGQSQHELLFAATVQERALKALSTSKYPGMVGFLAGIRLGRVYADLKRYDALPEVDARTTDFLEKALVDGSIVPGDERFLADQLTAETEIGRYMERMRTTVYRIIASNTQLDPWLKEYLWGRHRMALAWSARGNGFANTVTEEGWRAFSTRMAEARKHMVKSWGLQPKQPHAATALISVSMSDGTTGELRQWFDRAVAAQFDFPEAYDSLLWALRPRWGGSLEAMVEFGKRCLETKRFDTDVPWVFHDAMRGLAVEYQNAGWSRAYGKSANYTALKELFEGYLAEPTRRGLERWYRAYYGTVAYIAERYPDARAQFEKLDWKIDTNLNGGWAVDLALMPMEVAARTGPAADAVSHAEMMRLARKTSKALDAYAKASLQGKNDARTVEFAQLRSSPLELELKLDTGDWVDLMPNEKRRGWNTQRGEFKADGDGKLIVNSGTMGHLAYSRARVGADFEIEAEVELMSTSNDAWQAGLVFGMPGSTAGDWYGLRIKTNATEMAVGSFARAWARSKDTVAVDLQPVNQLKLIVDSGRVQGWVNGTLVVDESDFDRRGIAAHENTLVGIGAYEDQNRVEVRYRSLKVRRLKQPDPR